MCRLFHELARDIDVLERDASTLVSVRDSPTIDTIT